MELYGDNEHLDMNLTPRSLMDESTGVVEHAEQPFTPVTSKNKIRKSLNATKHHIRISFLELAEKKKDLVKLKTKAIESKQDSCLIQLREDKVRLEMELLKKSFENDKKRKKELHEFTSDKNEVRN